jgi:hypothetical protein
MKKEGFASRKSIQKGSTFEEYWPGSVIIGPVFGVMRVRLQDTERQVNMRLWVGHLFLVLGGEYKRKVAGQKEKGHGGVERKEGKGTAEEAKTRLGPEEQRRKAGSAKAREGGIRWTSVDIIETRIPGPLWVVGEWFACGRESQRGREDSCSRCESRLR